MPLLLLEAEIDAENGKCEFRELTKQSPTHRRTQNVEPDEQVTLIFNNPASLTAFSQQVSSATSPTHLAVRRGNDSKTDMSLTSVKTLRFGLLHPVTAETVLTPEEMHGGYRGAFTEALAKGWRDAFRPLNDCWPHADLCVRIVVLDFANCRNMEARDIVRLVQLVTTVMSVRSAKAGKGVSFEIVGEQPQNRGVLKGALPKPLSAVA